MTLQDRIFEVFRQVAQAHARELAPLTADLKLAECGLDSLSFAVVITTLEETLKLDPFRSSEAVAFPATLGELVKLYDMTAGFT